MKQVIRTLLENKLLAFVTSQGMTKSQVYWENVATVPTGDYFRAQIFPSPTQDPSLGAKHQRFQGIFRITYFSTNLNAGTQAITTLIDNLIKQFPRGTQLTDGTYYVNIESTPSDTEIKYSDNKYAFVAVDVRYRMDIISS